MATRVIIWFGPVQHGSEQALSKLSSLSLKTDFDWDCHQLSLAEGSNPKEADTSIALSFALEIWNSIGFLLKRAWFERLWIWQGDPLRKT